MTKAKAARASLAIILAVALTLCGILLFDNTAKAEETVESYSGEYYITIARTDSNANSTDWFMTGSVSSSTLVAEKIDTFESLPTEIKASEAADKFVFVFELVDLESQTYKIAFKGATNANKKYLAYSGSSTGVAARSESEASIIKVVPADNGKVHLMDTGSSRYLGFNKNINTENGRWYTSGGGVLDITLIKVVSETACEHTETKLVGAKDATCTKDGHTGNTVCSDCGETVVVGQAIPAVGYHSDVTYVNGKLDATCAEAGYTGDVHCSVCDEMISEGQVIPSEGHNFVDGICTVCGTEDHDYSGTYYFVAFRSSGNGWFMSNDLGTASTKRYQAIEGGEVLPSYAISGKDTKHEFTVVKNEDGTYKIYANGIDDDAKYLGWSSGNSGMLVEESNALNLTLTENEDGTVTFSFESGSDTRCLSLNGTTGNDYFAWYRGTGKHNLTLIPVVSGFDITGAQVNVGADLKITYRVEVLDGMISENDTLAMKFTKGGETVTVSAAYSEGTVYYFTIGGIAPHQMGDTIDAELVVIKDGVETTVDSKIGYSVAQNLINLLNDHADNEKLVALVNDLLAYGRAAQAYKNYNTGNVIGGDLTLVPTDNKPENSDKAIMSGNNVFIDNAGVRFDDVIKLYFTFKGLDDDIVVTVNGKAYTKADMEDMGGTYRLYTGALSATELDKVFNVTAGDATLTYSANAYAYSIQNNSQNENMKALALALYRYGISAKAYAAN